MPNPYPSAEISIDDIAKMLSFPDASKTADDTIRRLASNTLAARNDINYRLPQLERKLSTDTGMTNQPDVTADTSGSLL